MSGRPTETLWAFADQSGSVTTWARFDATGLADVRHIQLDTFGGYVAAFGATTGVLTRPETIFQGWRQDTVSGLFEAQGRLYDPVNNRFTTQGAVSPESPNPYLLGSNDPLNKGRDWTGIDGPGAFGAFGAFGYGAWDTLTAGLFGQAVGSQSEAMENGWYWAGATTTAAATAFFLAPGFASLAARGAAYSYGLAGLGVGLTGYQAYQLSANWDQMSSTQKVGSLAVIAGGFVGGWAGYARMASRVAPPMAEPLPIEMNAANGFYEGGIVGPSMSLDGLGYASGMAGAIGRLLMISGMIGVSAAEAAAYAVAASWHGPGIGRSGYKTMATFRNAVFERYQGFVDSAYQSTMRQVVAGKISNTPTRIGQVVDARARSAMRRWLQSEGISEGSGELVEVNRWLRNPNPRSSIYRIPDVRIPGANIIYDATIGVKTVHTPQIIDFRSYSGGGNIVIVRPTSLGGSYGIVFP